MMRRLAQIRLRLIDAVIIAALAVLGLKLTALLADPSPKDILQRTASVSAGEQLPPFFRAIANARTNYVPPDVTMTGAVPDKQDEKKETVVPALQDRGTKKPAVDSAPPPSSPAERALLERLGERREEIQQRGRELDMREKLLENAERRIETKLNELRELQAKEQESNKGDSEAAAIRSLVTMYEAMKPKDAARVFDRLAHEVLVPVVLRMNPRKMAEVMAVMSPEAAERLTMALAMRPRAKEAEARAAQGAPAALPATELPAIEPPAPRR